MMVTSVLIGLYMYLSVDIVRCNLLRVFPQNTAVIAGQVMAIECRTHNGATVREWTRMSSNRDKNRKIQQQLDSEKIFSNWNNQTTHLAEFWVDADQYGSGTLYSNYTKLEDAGIYVCVVDVGNKANSWSVHLIVLESTPFCDTNLNGGNSLTDGDRIWMRCSVRFRGYWTPSMEWRHHTGNKAGQIVTADEAVENENFNITSKISIIFNSSISGSFFSCKIYFSTKKHTRQANAANTPNFSYVWKSSEITTTVPTTNFYLVSLTAAGILAAFFCFVTTILCIPIRKTSSAKLVEMPLDEVDGKSKSKSISSGQRALSSSASLYENIYDEATTTPQTGQDTTHLTVVHPGSQTSFTADPVSLCPVQQIPVIDKGYENVSTCICRGNQPFQTALTTLPTTDTECPSPVEHYPQDNSAVEAVA